MDRQQGSPEDALSLLRALVMRDEELVGEEPLARLLECARAAVGATSARLERSVVPAASLPVVLLADGSVRVTSPEGGGRHPMLVLGAARPESSPPPSLRFCCCAAR